MKNNELTKEEKDRLLLNSENVIGFASACAFAESIIGATSMDISDPIRAIIIGSSTVMFTLCAGYCVKIEKEAGYYKCSKCGYEQVPEKYIDVLFAPHMGRTRYLKCPECGEKSWQKKVLTKTKKDIK